MTNFILVLVISNIFFAGSETVFLGYVPTIFVDFPRVTISVFTTILSSDEQIHPKFNFKVASDHVIAISRTHTTTFLNAFDLIQSRLHVHSVVIVRSLTQGSLSGTFLFRFSSNGMYGLTQAVSYLSFPKTVEISRIWHEPINNSCHKEMYFLGVSSTPDRSSNA
jgi:hypothetical protein